MYYTLQSLRNSYPKVPINKATCFSESHFNGKESAEWKCRCLAFSRSFDNGKKKSCFFNGTSSASQNLMVTNAFYFKDLLCRFPFMLSVKNYTIF